MRQSSNQSNQYASVEQQKADAIKKAQKQPWPGMEEFKAHEIAWICNYDSSKKAYTASPYPLVGGRLRLLREDHAEPGEKYSILPPAQMADNMGIIEIEVRVRKKDGGYTDIPGYRVFRTVETKRGLYLAVKDGSKDNLEKLETMAVARALRFAGYGFGFTSAEEMIEFTKAEEATRPAQPESKKQPESTKQPASEKQETPKDDTLGQLKGQYFTLIKDNNAFVDDAERHKWQDIAVGKLSSTMWKDADFKKAILILHWRLAVGKDSDELLASLGAIKPYKGMAKTFLAIMGVDKVTNIPDVANWHVAMSAAKLNFEHKDDQVIEMGKVLLRAAKHVGLVEKFLELHKAQKVSQIKPEQIPDWEKMLSTAFDIWETEQVDYVPGTVKLEELLKGPEVAAH